MQKLSDAQRIGLVLLRTLIGWHFLYEGYYKLAVPGWSRQGALLSRWSAAGYLSAATGPLAGEARIARARPVRESEPRENSSNTDQSPPNELRVREVDALP